MAAAATTDTETSDSFSDGSFQFTFQLANGLFVQRRHAWVFFAAVALILALAAIISGIIIFEPHDEDFTVRVVGVVAILDGCFSLCVPLSQLGRATSPSASRGLLVVRINRRLPR